MISDSFMFIAHCRLGIVRLRRKVSWISRHIYTLETAYIHMRSFHKNLTQTISWQLDGRRLQLERAQRQSSDEPHPAVRSDSSVRLQPSFRLRAPGGRHNSSIRIRPAIWLWPAIWFRTPVCIRPTRDRDIRPERHARPLRQRLPARRVSGCLGSSLRHCSCPSSRVALCNVNYRSANLKYYRELVLSLDTTITSCVTSYMFLYRSTFLVL
jgi:hypothetical protein